MDICRHGFVYNTELYGYPDEFIWKGNTIANFRIYCGLFIRTDDQPRSICKDHGRSFFASDPNQSHPEIISADIRVYHHYEITEKILDDRCRSLMAHRFCYKHEALRFFEGFCCKLLYN